MPKNLRRRNKRSPWQHKQKAENRRQKGKNILSAMSSARKAISSSQRTRPALSAARGCTWRRTRTASIAGIAIIRNSQGKNSFASISICHAVFCSRAFYYNTSIGALLPMRATLYNLFVELNFKRVRTQYFHAVDNTLFDAIGLHFFRQ